MRRSAYIYAALTSLALAMPAVAQAPKAITLLGERLHPESVSISPDGFAYVGGMQGGVQRISLKTGKVEQFVKPGDYASSSTFGVLADKVNNILWACSNPNSPMSIKLPGADATSTLKGFDLKTGKGRYSLTLPGKDPMCNDIAVAKDGTVYATDTNASRILRLKKGATVLEDWHHDPAYATDKGTGLDGIALGGDGNLYVNNWQSNILARVEVKADGSAGKTTVLQSSRPMTAPDGLRSIGGLRFVQAESRGKVTIVTVDGDKADVQVVQEGLSSPTSADMHDGTIWYVQAEFSYFFDPSKRTQTPPPFLLAPVKAPAASHAHH